MQNGPLRGRAGGQAREPRGPRVGGCEEDRDTEEPLIVTVVKRMTAANIKGESDNGTPDPTLLAQGISLLMLESLVLTSLLSPRPPPPPPTPIGDAPPPQLVPKLP